MRCFHDPGYYYGLPDGHPFPMGKFAESRRILEAAGLRVDPPEPAAWDDLLGVHDPGYLDAIRRAALGPDEARRLGLPLREEELLHRSRIEVGGTLAALRAALTTGWACNLGGGTHHAYPDCGVGYCVLNDVAVAIRVFHRERPGARILVVDTDAHQGNGTARIFQDDPRVFTYSIHVGPNYPSRKEVSTLDVPLPRFAPASAFLGALDATLAGVFDRARPELVFWIAGADPHVDDRFGQMLLDDAAMASRDIRVLDTLQQAGAPVVVLYGGGYNRTPGKTARLHAETVLRVAAAAQSGRGAFMAGPSSR